MGSLFTVANDHDLEKLVRIESSVNRAIAVIQPTKGHTVSGVFSFEQLSDGVKVTAYLSGLKPNAKHGVHIHEYGDITDMIAGKSAGGHYNPEGRLHGLPPNKERHAGAFGNLTTNDAGESKFEFVDHTITIVGLKNPIVGRAVVVHANEDTGAQPAGNAGPRIGVGVIGIAKYLKSDD